MLTLSDPHIKKRLICKVWAMSEPSAKPEKSLWIEDHKSQHPKRQPPQPSCSLWSAQTHWEGTLVPELCGMEGVSGKKWEPTRFGSAGCGASPEEEGRDAFFYHYCATLERSHRG